MVTSMNSRWPAEWEPHALTIVAWPGRAAVWGDHLDAGRDETAHLVRLIAEHEPVLVAADPQQFNEVNTLFEGHSDVRVEPIRLDDCWARDISPLFVIRGLVTEAVNFRFNAWGGKFHPHTADTAFGATIASRLGIPLNPGSLVLEGGSISTDGAGTALIVETTVLGPARNPTITKADVEAILAEKLGIEVVVWLPFGLLGDTDTDGHTDNVAVFCGEGRILAQAPIGNGHPDDDRLRTNLGRLATHRDARGRQLDIVEVPWLPVSKIDSSRPCSYVNAYPVNGAVVVPIVGGAVSDDAALELISTAFGGLVPKALAANALSFGGGGPHCMTMQVPQTVRGNQLLKEMI
jgi:agmatine deiminase